MAVSIRDAMLVYRTLSGNGSVLAFCEAVCASGRFGRPLGGPRGPGGLKGLKVLKWSILSVFWLQKGTPGLPAPRRVLQEGPRDVWAKTAGFRVSIL